MTRPRWLLALPLAAACSREAPRPPPARRIETSLVVVTLDTVRADHLGCYGYFRDTTPQLDAFSKQSLRFTRCLAPIAHTTPSHFSLFTGVHPLEHGIVSNPTVARLVSHGHPAVQLPRLKTFAQAIAARGYRTGAFVSALPVMRPSGLAAGFDTWSEPRPHESRRVARETIREAVAFLDRVGGEPFFAWIHLFDAHGPVARPKWPSPGYLERFQTDEALQRWLRERGVSEEANGRSIFAATCKANNEYDALLRFLDDQLDELFERLDADDLRGRTVVVVTADHGEGLGQHGVKSHGFACFDEQFRVPLLVRVPGLEPGVVDVPLSTIDLLPTIAGLAPGLRDDAYLAQGRGHDVRSATFEPRPLFGMAAEGRGAASLATERYRLVLGKEGVVTLFDLEHDPHELHDVAADHPEVVARLRKELDAELAGQRSRCALPLPTEGGQGAVDPKLLEELRALGYGEGEGASEEAGESPPPKDEGGDHR